MVGIYDAEAQTILGHMKGASDAIMTWQTALLDFVECLYAVNGEKLEDALLIRFVGLAAAWNNLKCAYEVTLRGYDGPAKNLLRLARDLYVMSWYLEYEPSAWQLFSDATIPEEQRPSLGKMRGTIEHLHREQLFAKLDRKAAKKQWKIDKFFIDQFFDIMRILDRFAHADAMTIVHMVDNDKRIRLGPQNDVERFRSVAGPAILMLHQQFFALRVLLHRTGDTVPQALDDAVAKLEVFLAKENMRVQTPHAS